MSSILRVQNLGYKDILNEVSLELEENTFNILIGSSGSGKTTLIKCIMGLVNYSGQIVFDGKIMCEKDKEIRKNIGVLSSFNKLLDGTVFDNLIYPLLNLKYSDSQAKKMVYENSLKFNINNILFKNVKELSNSQKKIVLFIISIIHKPKFIIIDDSFDELDSISRDIIINYLKSKKRTTILFITNNENDILISDYLAIMKKGKIISFDKTKKLLKDDNIFIKNNLKLPFIVSLSHKLNSYQLIDKLILDEEEMVMKIWN